MSTDVNNTETNTDEPETVVEYESVEDATPFVQDKKDSGKRRRILKLVGAGFLVVALLAAVGTTAWFYTFWYRVDQQTDADAAKVAVDAASAGTVAVLTYSPETVEQDFANAKTHLTGDFLAHYTGFTEQIVLPAAKQKQVKTSAAVVQAAVAELEPESAVVLVFVNQTTTSKENPDGAFAASAVRVSMDKVDGRWLISEFQPV